MSTSTPAAKPKSSPAAKAKAAPGAEGKSAAMAPPPPGTTLRTWTVALVTCDKGHPLRRLYVIFRAKPADPKAVVPFAIGMTDGQGWLGPVDCDPKLINAARTLPRFISEKNPPAAVNKWPETHKVVPNTDYEFLFVQHPDPQLANTILRLVNEGGADPDDPTKRVEAYVKGGDLAKLRKCINPRNDWYPGPTTLKPNSTGTICVPEDPTIFLPGGAPFYEKWCLFRDMPSAACEPVKKQVFRLQAHLGAMRFPFGDQKYPYAFAAVDGEGGFSAAGGPNGGIFDVRTWSAVLSFQQTTPQEAQRRQERIEKAKAEAAAAKAAQEAKKRKAQEAKAAKASAGKGKGKGAKSSPAPAAASPVVAAAPTTPAAAPTAPTPTPPDPGETEVGEASEESRDVSRPSDTRATALYDTSLVPPLTPFALANPGIRGRLIQDAADDPAAKNKKDKKYDPVLPPQPTVNDRKLGKSLESLKEHWAYLDGKKGGWPKEQASKADGVVEGSTAEAIKAWLDAGLRKPGSILVKGTTAMSEDGAKSYTMRVETALSLFAWGHLVRALGVPEGVRIVHGYRNPLAEINPGAVGVAGLSPHKTGLAIDTNGHHYRHGERNWPVVYVRTTQAQREDKQWRYRDFEVYAPSTQLLPGMLGPDKAPATAEALCEALKEQIKRYSCGGDDEGISAFTDAFKACKAALLARITPATFFQEFYARTVHPWKWDGTKTEGGEEGPEVTPQQHWALQQIFYEREKTLDTNLANAETALQQATKKLQAAKGSDQIKEAQAELAHARAVHEKAEDEHERGQVTKEDSNSLPPPKGDRLSFLNLSEVARLARLSPIFAATGWNLRYPGLESHDLEKIANTIEAALAVPEFRDGVAATKEGADKKDAKGRPPEVIKIQRASAKYAFPLDALDCAFLRKWKETLDLAAPLPKKGNPKVTRTSANKLYEVTSPQLAIKLSLAEGRDGDPDAVAKLLEPHNERLFYAPAVGSGGTAAIRKGSEWVTHVKDMMSELQRLKTERAEKAQATASTTQTTGAGGPANGAGPTKKAKAPAQAKAKEPPVDMKEYPIEKWSLTLQPIFVKDYKIPIPEKSAGEKSGPEKAADKAEKSGEVKIDITQIPLFPGDTAIVPLKGEPRGQEWWHFQRTDLSPIQWYERMREIGWPREALRKGQSDELYGRSGMGHKEQ